MEKKELGNLKTPEEAHAWAMETVYQHDIQTGQYNFFMDGLSFVRDGCQKVVDDAFNKCFTPNTHRPWSWTPLLFLGYCVGIFIRYCIFFPIRCCILIFTNTFYPMVFLITKMFPNTHRRQRFERWLIRRYAGTWIKSFFGVVRLHGTVPKHKPNQIYVSNHTTILDYMVLTSITDFGFVAQKQYGTFGFIMDTVLSCLNNVVFDRSINTEKNIVNEKIKEQIQDPSKGKLLVFPEGVCVNNRYCILFKKGVFELGANIVPIALKYNKFLADPYWSSKDISWWGYNFKLMKSWMLNADVWFLPAQTKRENETSAEFADRVKHLICEQAELIPTSWDGYLKHYRPSQKLIEDRQKRFYHQIISNMLLDPVLEKIVSPAPENSCSDGESVSSNGSDHSIEKAEAPFGEKKGKEKEKEKEKVKEDKEKESEE